jgi:hypothetical protein
MSQENVEIVRRGFEAALRGEWDLAARLLDRDVELHGTVGGLSEGSVARGLEQIRQEFEIRIQGYMDRAAALEAAGLRK